MANEEENAAKRRKKCDDIAQKLGINADEVPAEFVDRLMKKPKPEEDNVSSSEDPAEKDDVVYVFEENEPLTEDKSGETKTVWGKLPGNIIIEQDHQRKTTTLHSSNLVFEEKEAKRARRLFTTMRGGGTQIVGLNWERAKVILSGDTPLKQVASEEQMQDLAKVLLMNGVGCIDLKVSPATVAGIITDSEKKVKDALGIRR